MSASTRLEVALSIAIDMAFCKGINTNFADFSLKELLRYCFDLFTIGYQRATFLTAIFSTIFR